MLCLITDILISDR